MMTTNLFVIANVKQLRTDGSFRILLPFFRTSWCVGVLNSASFNSFHNSAKLNPIVKTVTELLNLVHQHPKMFGKKAVKFAIVLH